MTELHSRLEAIRARHPEEWTWTLIVRAEEAGMLPSSELAEMITSLERGRDWTSVELSLDFLGDELRVRFLDEVTMTAPAPIVAAVRSLVDPRGDAPGSVGAI